MFTVSEIKELMEAMRLNAMGKLKIENGDYAIELESAESEITVDTGASAAGYRAAVPRPQDIFAPPPAAPSGKVVSSPIVGTYYSAPSPESEPFVQVGSQVKKGDVLFIIESMKLMNEVTCQFDGTVAEIHVANAEGVEYGQPIMTIR